MSDRTNGQSPHTPNYDGISMILEETGKDHDIWRVPWGQHYGFINALLGFPVGGSPARSQVDPGLFASRVELRGERLWASGCCDALVKVFYEVGSFFGMMEQPPGQVGKEIAVLQTVVKDLSARLRSVESEMPSLARRSFVDAAREG